MNSLVFTNLRGKAGKMQGNLMGVMAVLKVGAGLLALLVVTARCGCMLCEHPVCVSRWFNHSFAKGLSSMLHTHSQAQETPQGMPTAYNKGFQECWDTLLAPPHAR